MRDRLACFLGRNLPVGTVLAALAFAATPNPAAAQLPQARLYSVFPPGGQAGTTLDLTAASGADLDELAALHFSHPGITAKPKPQAGANTFEVTIAGDVPPGVYEVRASGLFGLTNPRLFEVGSSPEIQETEPNNAPAEAAAVELNRVINGRSGATGDVDYFKFSGTKGTRLLVECFASRIDSRMSPTLELYDSEGHRLELAKNSTRGDALLDATLPGDGEYLLKVYDFAYAGGADYFYRVGLQTGPHIDFILPPAGLPGTTAKYTLYGRNVPGGQPADVSTNGRPLEKLEVEIALPENPALLNPAGALAPYQASLDGIGYRLKTESGASNSVFIQFAGAAVGSEAEPNDDAAHAQTVATPGELAGQFQAVGDTDIFQFEAKANQVFVIEVFAQRNGTMADPFFTVDQVTKDANGAETLKRIVAQDDTGPNLAPGIFDTETNDPIYRFQAPADGLYRITLRDRYFETRGDPGLVYRLAIRPEDPDFRLVAVPYQAPEGSIAANSPRGLSLRKGGNENLTVIAFREDGFSGRIDLYAEGLPEGVVCHPASIGPGETQAELIFTAAENAPEWAGLIQVKGKTFIDDPAKVQAAEAARTALRAANAERDAADIAVRDSAAAAAAANQKINEAVAAAKQKPDDATLQQALIDAVKAAAAADAAAKVAQEKQAAAATKAADAKAAFEKARQEQAAAAREVVREARAGTVVWEPTASVPVTARVGWSLGLAVMKEPAPFQVTTDVSELKVYQGRQILLPVKLAKRLGFDNDVALAAAGLPANSNITVENKPIKKGTAEELVRIFINNNARVGTFTAFFRATGQVSYQRNPARVERAKAAQAEATKAAEAAAQALAQATAARDEAVKVAEANAAKLKAAEEAKAAAEKKNADAAALAKAAAAEKAKTGEVAANVTAAAKSAADAAARAKAAADAVAENAALAEAAAAAQKLAKDLEAAAKAATTSAEAASKKSSEADAAAKMAAEAAAAAQKAFEEAQAAAKASAEAKAAKEQAAAKADAHSKAAANAKKAADDEVAAAEKAAAPQNINSVPPSTPIVITVQPAPATLTPTVPDGGNLKRGGKVDVTVAINRANGFAGPVTLSLPVPPGIQGVSAAPVTVAPDQSSGVLSIQAAADAAEGQLANLVVRASMEYDGETAEVDVPVAIKVVP